MSDMARERVDIEPLDAPIVDADLLRLIFLVGGRDAEDWASGLYKRTLFSFNTAVHEALTIIASLSRGRMDRLQAEVMSWADSVFPTSNDASKLNHLRRELSELADACVNGWDVESVREEAADCVLILMHFAAVHGFSLFDACRGKFEVAKKRKWGEPDAENVVEHVREAEDPALPGHVACGVCGGAHYRNDACPRCPSCRPGKRCGSIHLRIE